MPLICYTEWSPSAASMRLVDIANTILTEYAAEGYDLSLRQLYYQFVARDHIPNTQASYNRLGSIIAKARDAGLVDWNRITDRGRSTYGKPTWDNGEDFLYREAHRFGLDLWQGQPTRCQVWVEKDALSGIVQRAANPYNVDYFPNKGYVSASSIWNSARAMLHSDCDNWVVLHLGDHDPSGIDMSRDIKERLRLYSTPTSTNENRPSVTIKRIALNMDQVRQYSPPPNPAKVTDSRYATYQRRYGDDSWELDALEPSVLVDLISKEIEGVLEDGAAYRAQVAKQEAIRDQLKTLTLEDA